MRFFLAGPSGDITIR